MSFDLKEKLLYEIKNIALRYAIDRICLFASRARGDCKATSDIDLAIFTLPGFKNKGYFVSEIDDLETLLKIDTIIINENIDPQLLENIKKEGVVIYERSQNKI